MLKLVVYKKKACIYLVGGTNLALATFSKNTDYFTILSRLRFILIGIFWDTYKGIYHKGKFHKANTIEETAKFIEERLKEN